MPSPPTRPAALRKNDRRKQDIVETAMSLFAAVGPDGVSLRDVAKAIGIQVGTLYYYFPEKQGLYQSVVDHALAESSRVITAAIRPEDDASAQLAAIIDAHFHIFAAANPIGAIADRELLAVATDADGARLLSSRTVAVFRKSQQAFKAVVAEIAGLAIDAPIVDWLQEFAISSIYGVARVNAWYDQTRESRPIAATDKKAHLHATLTSAFIGIGGRQAD